MQFYMRTLRLHMELHQGPGADQSLARTPPLRSTLFPNGLPTLTPNERERVSKANESYKVTVQLIRKLISLEISVSVENPIFFWLVSDDAALLDKLQPQHSTIFHHCMHGGKRDKQTAWWSWNPRKPHCNLFSSLALECDKQHSHEPWQPYKDPQGCVPDQRGSSRSQTTVRTGCMHFEIGSH